MAADDADAFKWFSLAARDGGLCTCAVGVLVNAASLERESPI